MLSVPCPQCKTLLQTPEQSAGQIVRCPKCGTMMRIASPGTDKTPRTQVTRRADTGLSGGATPPGQKPAARKTGSPPPAASNRAPHPKTVLEPPTSAPRPPAPQKPLPGPPNLPPKAAPAAIPRQGPPATNRGTQGPMQLAKAPRTPVRPSWWRRLALCALLILVLAGGGGAYYWFYARETIETLMRDLDAGDSQVRSRAAEQLGKMGPRGQEAVEKLISKLADDDPKVREMVKGALNQIGPPADSGILRRYLHDDNADARYYAAETLADKVTDAPPEVLQALERAFKDERNTNQADIRNKVMKALVKFANQDTDLVLVLILERGLGDPDPKIKDQAEEGLKQYARKAIQNKKLRKQAFREIVVRFKARDRHMVLRASLDAVAKPAALAEASQELWNWKVDIEKDFDVLKQYLTHEDSAVRCQTLRLIATTPAVPDRGVVLRALLRGLNDADTRAVAQERLLALGLDAKHDLPILKEEVITASFFANREVQVKVHLLILQEIIKTRRETPERSWAVEVLQNCLRGKDLGATVRTTALDGLTTMLDGKADCAILCNLVKHPPWGVKVRRMAVTKLAEVDLTPASVPVLSEVLEKEEEKDLRQTALGAFTRALAKPEMIRPALVLALRDSETAIGERALATLKTLPPPTTIEASGLRAPKTPVQFYTAYSAGRLGRGAAAVLREALNHSAKAIRTEALSGMKGKDGKFDVEFIEKDLPPASCEQHDVRLELIKALAEAEWTTSRAALLRERLEKKDEQRAIRCAALRAFTKPDLKPEWVRLVLVAVLGDEEETIRHEALEALKKLPAPADTEARLFAAQLKRKESVREVRLYAANALLQLGPKATEAIPELTAALADSDDEVVSFCAQALGAVGLPAAAAIGDLAKVATNEKLAKGRRSALEALLALERLQAMRQDSSLRAFEKAIHDSDIELQTLAARAITQLGIQGDFKLLADKMKDKVTAQAVVRTIVKGLAELPRNKLSRLEPQESEALAGGMIAALKRHRTNYAEGPWKDVNEARQALLRARDRVLLQPRSTQARQQWQTVYRKLEEALVHAYVTDVKTLKAETTKVEVFVTALAALGKGAVSSEGALIGALKDRNPLVQWVAVEALGKIGPDALVARLPLQLLQRNRKAVLLVRQAAGEAVKRINRGK